jgi:Secretion system C-terminal sorting domain
VETFYINVGPCLLNMGIQAMIFSAVGCSTFTPMSACFNPGTAVSGSIVASGLTPGQTYYLMIDGQAGDDCDFTVTNTPVLPVEWGQISLNEVEGAAVLEWQTWSELNNLGFEIQRGQPSSFGESGSILWEDIGFVGGGNTTQNRRTYSFTDASPVNDRDIWYRIKQIDVDGFSNFSEIMPWRQQASETSLKVYPVPTSDVLHLQYNTALESASSFVLFDLRGEQVMLVELEAGILHTAIDVSSLPDGLYLYRSTLGRGKALTGKVLVAR